MAGLAEPDREADERAAKVVFSSTLSEVEWTNARVTHRQVEEEIPELKGQPGKDIVVFGGVSFARSLAGHGLIDEYRLTVQPVALGDGAAPAARLARAVGARARQQRRLGRRPHHPNLRTALSAAHGKDTPWHA